MTPASQTILVFPAGMPEGLAYNERAVAHGDVVIGASSLKQDPTRSAYRDWDYLPFVTDADFDGALADIIRRRGISAVFTPHFVVHHYLSRRLEHIAPGTALAACRTPQDEERSYRALRQSVAALPSATRSSTGRPPLREPERIGLVRLVETIPGMCGREKIAAIIDVMRHAPSGDIVEIGSWWGRSAALFVWLARRHDIGAVLCIDPWIATAMSQGNLLLDSTSRELDTEEALRIFEINLAPLAGTHLNYFRATSDAAALQYGENLVVHTTAFGSTRYTGRISVLHIDGNHDAGQVGRDVAAWTPHVVPGGWIIFDDYEWAFGDGPRRVADDFVARETANVAATRRAGPALFVQLKGGVNG